MSHQVTPPSPAVALGRSEPSERRLRGRWLFLAQAVWIVMTFLTLIYFVVSLPIEFGGLQTVCTHAGCGLTPTNVRELGEMGLSVGFFAAYFITVDIVFTLVWFAVGAVIFWHRSNDRMALFVALFLVTFGGIDFSGAIDVGFPGWHVLTAFLLFFANTSSFLLFYLFPDARFVPRFIRWLAVVIAVLALCLYFFPDTVFSQWLSSFRLEELMVILATGVLAQLYRYWRVSEPVQRQQAKWVVFGLTTAVVGRLGVGITFQVLSLSHVLFVLVGNTVMFLSQLLIPLTIGVAILRYRLWDINMLINRTLVYGMLTGCVIGLYTLIVGGLSALLQARGTFLISLLAAGLIAILFQPLRLRLQRSANRLLYGERDDPYRVLTRLGQRLETALAPEAILPTIVETVAQALKLPYAAILLKDGNDFTPAASSGVLVGDPLTLPLIYQGKPIGQLQLAPRSTGEAFSSGDMRLLYEVARQAGLAVHAVRLTTDLQRARERLVLAREEERRRLRRDLHDGLGPTLASLSQRLDTACHLVPSNPDAAITLLRTLKVQVKSTIGDIRRVVYALRPPVLDEFGLVSALREHITSASQSNGLRVSFEAPLDLPPLPAAVEVAAYRIVLEALTNVERHAHAQTCCIRLELVDGRTLCLEVIDDGTGLSQEAHAGVGMTSMRERAEELGGECSIKSRSAEGTHVWAKLPVPNERRPEQEKE